jgi:hypothetical protein
LVALGHCEETLNIASFGCSAAAVCAIATADAAAAANYGRIYSRNSCGHREDTSICRSKCSLALNAGYRPVGRAADSR